MSQLYSGEFFGIWPRRHEQVDVVVVAPATVEPVSIDMLKAQERVDATDDQDALLPIYISSARTRCENYCERTFPTQTLMMSLDRFGHNRHIFLRRPPVLSVLSVTYLDPTTQMRLTVDPTTYACDLDYNAPRLFKTDGNCWPQALHRPGSIQITYTAGYPIIPASVIHACLLLAADGYRNRGSILEVPDIENPTVTNLLSNFRTF